MGTVIVELEDDKTWVETRTTNCNNLGIANLQLCSGLVIKLSMLNYRILHGDVESYHYE